MPNLIAENIKVLMKANKISINELAEKTGLSYWTITKYLRGERTPNSKKLSMIADLLNTSTDFIVGRKPLQQHIEEGNEEVVDKGIEAIFDARRKLKPKQYDELVRWVNRMTIIMLEESEDENKS